MMVDLILSFFLFECPIYDAKIPTSFFFHHSLNMLIFTKVHVVALLVITFYLPFIGHFVHFLQVSLDWIGIIYGVD